MGTHIQRKRFDDQASAVLTLEGYQDIDPSVPGAQVVADIREIGGDLWVYVTTEGNLVTGAEPALPGYEKVDG